MIVKTLTFQQSELTQLLKIYLLYHYPIYFQYNSNTTN